MSLFASASARLQVLLSVISFSVFSSSAFAVPIPPPGTPIFSDANLQQCFEEQVQLNGWTTTEEVTSLSCSSRNIFNLFGIQEFVNLTILDVSDNKLYDLYPLEMLPQLSVLNVARNDLYSAHLLTQVTTLQQLDISWNTRLVRAEVEQVILANPGMTHLSIAGINMSSAPPGQYDFINWLPSPGFNGEYRFIELDISFTGQYFDLQPLFEHNQLRVLKASGLQLVSPVSLENLTQLEWLDLSGNRLIDLFPLQSIMSLKRLDLSGNNQLPADQVNTLVFNNPQLTHLYLSHINMGNLAWLPQPGPQGEFNFIELDISYTGQMFDLFPLNQYVSLQVVRAAGNGLQTAYPLDFLTQLREIDLSDNELMDVFAIEFQQSLSQLNLSGNARLDGAQVANLVQQNPGLTHLGVADIQLGDLTWLPPVGFAGEFDLIDLDISNTGSFPQLYPIGQYQNLKSLKAASNNLYDIFGLEQLSQLEVIDLSHNQLIDINPIIMMTDVKQINLSYNRSLDGFSVRSFIEANPALTHIEIAGISLTDPWLPPRGTMGEYDLQVIDVSYTGLQIDLNAFTQYVNLKELKAAGLQLRTAFDFAVLNQLEVIDLRDNYITDIGFLMSLTNIRELNLSDNRADPLDPFPYAQYIDAFQVSQVVQSNRQLRKLFVAGLPLIELNQLGILNHPDTALPYPLTDLDVSNTGLTDLQQMSGMSTLKWLKANNNAIQQTYGLENLVDLEVLDLSYNNLLDIFSLQGISSLTELNLTGNTQLVQLDVQNLVQANRQLTHLGLGFIPMTDLGWLPQSMYPGDFDLVELDIRSTINSYDLAFVISYNNLQILRASGLGIQDINALYGKMNLEVLDLQDNQIFDISPLMQMTQLKELYLSNNQSPDPFMPAIDLFQINNLLSQNLQLTHLGVAGVNINRLSDLNVFNLPMVDQLVYLDVSNSGMTDLSQADLLRGLKTFIASSNAIVDANILSMSGSLKYIDLSNNQLQYAVTLAFLPELARLDLTGNLNMQCADLDYMESVMPAGVLIRPASCVLFTVPEISPVTVLVAPPYYTTTLIELHASSFDAEDGVLDNQIQWSSSLSGFLGTGPVLSVNLPAGDHVLTASVTDIHGNRAASTVQLFVEANTVPVLSVYSITEGAIFNVDDAIMLQATASDAEQGDLSNTINWYSDRDGYLGTGANIQVLLSVGDHVITASVSDIAGASVSQSVSISINALPVLTLQSPATGSLFMLQESLTLQANASDLEDGDITAAIQWFSNIDGLIGIGGLVQTTLSLGAHQITATITDSAGASHSAVTSVIIEQIALGVSVSGNGRTKTATLTWSGSRTPVDIYHDGTIVASAGSEGVASFKFKDIARFKVCETSTIYCSQEVVVP